MPHPPPLSLQYGNNHAFRKSRSGVFRFSHQQLEKEGVILETTGIPEPRYHHVYLDLQSISNSCWNCLLIIKFIDIVHVQGVCLLVCRTAICLYFIYTLIIGPLNLLYKWKVVCLKTSHDLYNTSQVGPARLLSCYPTPVHGELILVLCSCHVVSCLLIDYYNSRSSDSYYHSLCSIFSADGGPYPTP